MQVDIRSLGFSLTDGLRKHAEQSLLNAFRHGRKNLVEVQVRLSDLNGPRGGEDKRCVIRARFVGDQNMVVSRQHVDLYAAITQATEILGGRSNARRRAHQGRRGVVRPERNRPD